MWEEGVITYDAVSGKTFRCRASLLWTMGDFPAYADLSGWSTKGKLACPTCNDQTPHRRLNNWRKTIYYDHRRWLPRNHQLRKNLAINCQVEKRSKLKLLSADDVIQQLAHVTQPRFGKTKKLVPDYYLNWTKVSIFYQLP